MTTDAEFLATQIDLIRAEAEERGRSDTDRLLTAFEANAVEAYKIMLRARIEALPAWNTDEIEYRERVLALLTTPKAPGEVVPTSSPDASAAATALNSGQSPEQSG